MSVIFGSLGTIVTEKPFEFGFDLQTLMIMFSGVLTFSTQAFVVLSMRYESPVTLGVFDTLSVLFGFVFDTLMTDVEVSPWSALGAVLVVMSCVIVALQRSTPPSSVKTGTDVAIKVSDHNGDENQSGNVKKNWNGSENETAVPTELRVLRRGDSVV